MEHKHGIEAEIQHLQQHGLHNPANEHDACGIGFIAHIKGNKVDDTLSMSCAPSSTQRACGSRARPLSFNTSRLPTRSNKRAPNRLSRSCKAALVADWERATLRAHSSVLITASDCERTEVGRELGISSY